ncbi:hypothetical protein [Streptomyces sp. NPDC056304]|uniref:hypothetical protein n=1 Tax=Streptomyces sp. NPDC056304 TaxID=3345778 RepID=UPI0035E31DEC
MAVAVRLAGTDRFRLLPRVGLGELKECLIGRPARQRQDLGDGPAAVGLGWFGEGSLVRSSVPARTVGR